MPSKRRKTGLTIVGQACPKARKPRKHEWTKAKEKIFLTALAETCNVTAAAEASGMSTAGAYFRRKRVAAFRAAWVEAVATAYRNLELVLLERALNGTEKIVTKPNGSVEHMREYPNQIALALLRMHRDTVVQAENEPSQSEVAELRQRLFDKLERLRRREEARGSAK